MQYGLTLPNIEPRVIATLAQEAEQAGWDGIFVWDTILSFDPWVSLAAVAMCTERIRIGTLITPVSRRRPWKLASETMTLDSLSNGRLILPVGLGATGFGHENDEFIRVGEETDRKTRAKLLDEGLDVLTGLWSVQSFSYEGEHYHVREATFSATPVQTPRIPIWVVGAWPRRKSMQRVLRYDGVLPMKMNVDRSSSDMTPADIREMKSFIMQHRTLTAPFDIVIEGETPGDDAARGSTIVQPYVEAGATWWLESVWRTPEANGGLEGMRTRVKQGPPRL